MSKFLILAVFLVYSAADASASNDWRSYQIDCGGRVKCMKAQAAAYEEFTYGEHNADFKRYCKSREIHKNARNYTGALRCVEKLQKEQDAKDAKERQMKVDEERAKYYEREMIYDKCMRSKKDTVENRKICTKHARRMARR